MVLSVCGVAVWSRQSVGWLCGPVSLWGGCVVPPVCGVVPPAGRARGRSGWSADRRRPGQRVVCDCWCAGMTERRYGTVAWLAVSLAKADIAGLRRWGRCIGVCRRSELGAYWSRVPTLADIGHGKLAIGTDDATTFVRRCGGQPLTLRGLC